MEIRFEKWEGTGNDFIVVDDRKAGFPIDDRSLIARLCHRHFGIGSDGLVLLRSAGSGPVEFHMEFFNPDGSRSFCGNGSRCAFAFWSMLTGAKGPVRFTAIDGEHTGEWVGEEVAISVSGIRGVDQGTDGPDVDFAHTGSPHEVVWVDDVEAIDLATEGPERRYAVRHGSGGSNVNFVQAHHGGIRMRTYERGVEAETLSCGSGVVAAALSAVQRGAASAPVQVLTRGGLLRVEVGRSGGDGFDQIRLIGPVSRVYCGTIEL